MKEKYILGISCFFHDSAAALIKQGQIIAAAHEERFTRKKNDDSFPINTVNWLLDSNEISWEDIEAIVYYEKPFLTFERLLENFLNYAPKGFQNFRQAIPLWFKKKLFLSHTFNKELHKIYPKEKLPPLYYSEHHLSHAASAFYPSPFTEALILTIDGVGEWSTTGVFLGKNEVITPLLEINFPHSLGLFYSAITAYLGFKVNSGEYKVMGLAPYGIPRFEKVFLNELIHLHEDGSFSLNLKYFGHTNLQKAYSPQLESLLGERARNEDEMLTSFHMDVAASLQAALERTIIHLLNHLAKKYPQRQLCLAGGVALNCVVNGKIKELTPFKDIWIQPAAGDAGGSIGGALAFYHLHQKNPRSITLPDAQKNSTLGPSYSKEQIEDFLIKRNLPIRYFETKDLCKVVAERLSNGEIAGWLQGPVEFGPRALGNRSILGDSRIPDMQSKMNLKIKFRESFRPFAPIALQSDIREYFNWQESSAYMQFVTTLKEEHRYELAEENDLEKRIHQIRSPFPAITHLDFSARIQSINDDEQRPIGELLRAFKEKTGVGMLINTSFNIRGEPIVSSLFDAYRCFCHTAIDFLVLGPYIIERKDLELDPQLPKKQEVILD